ncbi:trypsin-like peptidase domain-containing protein [Roseburia sp. BX1005]|uniref:Trypsin-like peptidase domain-containing protein n=1 Tax=Roseburia zhanii TaxID=2763064 RepID=A0A923LR12_9FIRM|nr:trypsin-like peptidase domain-containing protein [Roseburia zhanii]MBC5714484.1 trypsin-like peptidase domain-containing protein [Roseburia zhanii]
MAEQEKKEFAFIKEKIKEKPVNKKRLFKHGMYTVGFAVIFGVVSCFVFTCLRPVMENWLHPKADSTITIPGDEWSTEVETEEKKEPAEETEQAPVLAEAPQASDTVRKQELELSDYQMLQNKIYAIGKEANRSVVTVTGVVSDTDWYNNAYESEGRAAGIIIGDNGNELLILTEHKVVKDAGTINVTFIDDVTVQASLKKYDGNTGIAILAIDLKQLEENTKNSISYAVLGSSLSVAQGNIAIAIGSPLGTNYSIGTGNITSVGNVIHTADATYTVFTTDIVGSSSSSGVLLNLNGEVVGLVMQGYSNDGADNTLTAISISELKQIIEMLSNGKDIPYFGLKVVTVTDKIANDYDIPKGVYIKEVMMDSPAWETGLQNGDVIVGMDGEEITSVEAYQSKLLSLEPGSTIEVAVKRQGMNDYLGVTCNVTVGKLQ